jgi:CRP/FNR family cyclic AMP-dependent transcriptional regulator
VSFTVDIRRSKLADANRRRVAAISWWQAVGRAGLRASTGMHRKRIGSDGASRLASIDLFAGLSRGQLLMLARVLDEVTATAGETIMSEGEPGYEVLIIEDGSAEVLKGGSRVGVMGPGDIFGELAVLEVGGARTASVVATSPLRAMLLTAHFIREVRAQLPALGERIERVAAERRLRDEQRASGVRGSAAT